MKAAMLYGPNDLRIVEVPEPTLGAGGLIIRVKACAICGSDVRTYHFGARNVTYPQIIGHEVAGEIVEVSEEAKELGYKIGDRVAVAPAIPCGVCEYCRKGIQTMCQNLKSIGYEYAGGFAEYLFVPATAVRNGCVNFIPDNLSFSEATVAEPLACAINAQELLNVQMGDTVVVIGAGPIGCMHVALAKIRGATFVIAAERQQSRLDMIKDFGADACINTTEQDLVESVMQLTNGKGADVVIVAAASKEAQELSLQIAAKRGRIDFFGGLPKDDPWIRFNSNLVHYRELFIMGAYGSKPEQNRMALKVLSTKRIDPKKIVTKELPLDSILEGISMVEKGEVLKAVVLP